jgi:hypothetical protein
MPDDKRAEPPLASYVLRIRGQPATLRYELHDLRSGERRTFIRADRLAAFLREHGIEPAENQPVEPEIPEAGDGGLR